MHHKITIHNYKPPSLNQFASKHWSVRVKLKRECKQLIMAYGNHIPEAMGKRRVDMHITLGPRARKLDPDNAWKVCLDALVHNRLLVDDSDKWAELGNVTYDRGEPKTVIYLTEIPGHTYKPIGIGPVF